LEDESRIQVDQRVSTEKGPMKTSIFVGSNLGDVGLPILGEVSGAQDAIACTGLPAYFHGESKQAIKS